MTRPWLPALVLAIAVVTGGCDSQDTQAATQQAEAAAGASGSAGVAVHPGIRDASGFALWTADELRERDEGLSTRIGDDFSARETLADYGNHRFRYIRREGDGFPEQHDNIIDVVIVQSGQGVLLLGGEMVDPETSSPGEWRGSGIEGGERYNLGPGDVMHIPATVPHSFLVPDGQHFTYVLVKFPAP